MYALISLIIPQKNRNRNGGFLQKSMEIVKKVCYTYFV